MDGLVHSTMRVRERVKFASLEWVLFVNKGNYKSMIITFFVFLWIKQQMEFDILMSEESLGDEANNQTRSVSWLQI